ncbi:MAG: phosphocholine cytidylyltransferase family protein [Betaproteobacteria bacterium]
MKAIILAAGRGSRLKNLTDDCPKCLVTLRGKPLLDWQLEALRQAGISEIAIVTGYKRELLGDRGLIEFHNPRWEETNMVSSLACAQKWLLSEPCIVSYSDIFYVPAGVSSLITSSADLAVTYDPHWLKLWQERFSDPLIDAETFRLNSNNTLSEIGNSPKTVQEVEGQYMGLLRFTPAGWKEVLQVREGLSAHECDRMHMTGTLQKIIEAGRVPIEAIPYDGSWGEIDTVEDLMLYRS